MKQFLCISLFAFAGVANAGGACGIEGTAVFPDGSKHHNDGIISTSWDGKKVYPSKGWFELELDTLSCGKTISVYAAGKEQAKVRLPNDGGKARLDFVYR